MIDTLIGPGPSGLTEGALLALNPSLRDALLAVAAEITTDDVQDGDE